MGWVKTIRYLPSYEYEYLCMNCDWSIKFNTYDHCWCLIRPAIGDGQVVLYSNNNIVWIHENYKLPKIIKPIQDEPITAIKVKRRAKSKTILLEHLKIFHNRKGCKGEMLLEPENDSYLLHCLNCYNGIKITTKEFILAIFNAATEGVSNKIKYYSNSVVPTYL